MSQNAATNNASTAGVLSIGQGNYENNNDTTNTMGSTKVNMVSNTLTNSWLRASSETATKYYEQFKKIESKNTNNKITLLLMDSLTHGLGYSLILAVQVLPNSLVVVPLIIADAGKTVLTVGDISQKIVNQRDKSVIYTPVDVLNTVGINKINMFLSTTYGNIGITMLDTIVVPAKTDEDINMLTILLKASTALIEEHIAAMSGTISPNLKETMSNAIMRFNLTSLPGTVKTDIFGKKISVDTEISLSKTSILSAGKIDINAGEQDDVELCRVTTVLDAMPYELQERNNMGGVNNVIKMIPIVVVSSAITAGFTPFNFLLTILTAATASTPTGIFNAIYRQGANNKHGALNIITQSTRTPTGVTYGDNWENKIGEHSDLGEFMTLVKHLYNVSSPIMAFDISSGTLTSCLAGILVAGAKNNVLGYDSALRAIVKSAHTLTAGKFPVDYDIANIITAAQKLPDGTYMSPSGIRPLSEIDYKTLLAENRLDLANRYLQVMNDNSGTDMPYAEMIRIYSELKLSQAEITNEKYRVYLNATFVNTLLKSIAQLGVAGDVYTTYMVPMDTEYYLSNSNTLGGSMITGGIPNYSTQHGPVASLAFGGGQWGRAY